MKSAYEKISLDDIDIKRGIKSGIFYQFQIVGKGKEYQFWHKDSIYLGYEIFDLFFDCFNDSHSKFNEYGPTIYEKNDIKILIKKLDELLDSFKMVNNYESFKKLIEKISHLRIAYDIKKVEGKLPTYKTGGSSFLAEIENPEVNWKKILVALEKTGMKLINYFQKALNQNKTLWVLGI